ncbi:MAG TPA: DUF4388 domain-containing protein [Trueperaceae bacterium]|nr:DUF4388 domain-containing protein [Trueperaceae bacterium]
MTSLSGRLGPGALADLLQYLALSRATGCLLLRHPQRRQAYAYLEGGRVVFVDARPLYDVAALSELLGWHDGRFAFRPGVSAPRRTLDLPTEVLLIEATRRADERAPEGVDPDAVLCATNGEPSVPARPAGGGLARDDGPFGPVRVLGEVGGRDPFEVARADAPDSVSLSLGALNLWRRLDGASSLRQLAAASGRPLAEVVVAGAELLDRGLARYVSVTVADPRFALELAREAVDLLGPVGEIVVEDALYELGLTADAVPVGRVGELVAAIESAFGDGPSRQEFARRAAELRGLFALDHVPAGRQ